MYTKVYHPSLETVPLRNPPLCCLSYKRWSDMSSTGSGSWHKWAPPPTAPPFQSVQTETERRRTETLITPTPIIHQMFRYEFLPTDEHWNSKYKYLAYVQLPPWRPKVAGCRKSNPAHNIKLEYKAYIYTSTHAHPKRTVQRKNQDGPKVVSINRSPFNELLCKDFTRFTF